LRGAIIARGDLYYGAAAGLLEAVQHGGVPFEHVHNVSFFKYLAQHPERGVEFQASMVDRSRQEAAEVVAAYDFGSFGRLVDVGGGHGVLLTEILRAVPRLQAVLLDRLPVVERARERLEVAGLAGRCKFVAGDFFEAVPPGDDAAYVLSRVIHDWDDEVPASITTEGMGPWLAVEGATTGEVFEAYLEHFLAPALRPGQVVEMDNLSAHKVGRVRELVEGRGCELLYLPPYSPDYNPIEQAFSKLKGLLRRAGTRTREALVEALGRACRTKGALRETLAPSQRPPRFGG
jgi:transposase